MKKNREEKKLNATFVSNHRKMPPAAESPEAEEVAPTPAIKTAPIKIVQHLFLQALLSRKIVPQKAAQQLYIEFCKVCQGSLIRFYNFERDFLIFFWFCSGGCSYLCNLYE